MSVLGKLAGTPPDHKEEKLNNKVVEAPEFDITQYAKKLALVIGVLAPALAGLFKALKIEHVSSGMVIGALGVTAAALLGVCLVMAVDIGARAYLTGGSKKSEGGNTGESPESSRASTELALTPPAPGTMVWLDGDDEPHPVLAIAGDGLKEASYLVASGSTVDRKGAERDLSAVDGPPKWHSSEEVRAIRSRRWP